MLEWFWSIVSRGFQVLLIEHKLPWRFTRLGGFYNTTIKVPLRHIYLPILLNFVHRTSQEDITVILPIRNRYDYRIRNALRSLRAQDYPSELIHILIVDYGSDECFIPQLTELSKEFTAEYLLIKNQSAWNKAHCVNIGIRHTTTKYLLSSDTDIIFGTNYISEAIKELRRDPLQVIYSQTLDLPESWSVGQPEIDTSHLEQLKMLAKPRSVGVANAGINLTLTYLYTKIRGYDEVYKGWGSEDNDLVKRFELLGLRTVSLSECSYYFHQWHPKYEGVKDLNLQEQIRKNEEYFQNNHSIIRNPKGWGEIV